MIIKDSILFLGYSWLQMSSQQEHHRNNDAAKNFIDDLQIAGKLIQQIDGWKRQNILRKVN